MNQFIAFVRFNRLNRFKNTNIQIYTHHWASAAAPVKNKEEGRPLMDLHNNFRGPSSSSSFLPPTTYTTLHVHGEDYCHETELVIALLLCSICSPSLGVHHRLSSGLRPSPPAIFNITVLKLCHGVLHSHSHRTTQAHPIY